MRVQSTPRRESLTQLQVYIAYVQKMDVPMRVQWLRTLRYQAPEKLLERVWSDTQARQSSVVAGGGFTTRSPTLQLREFAWRHKTTLWSNLWSGAPAHETRSRGATAQPSLTSHSLHSLESLS